MDHRRPIRAGEGRKPVFWSLVVILLGVGSVASEWSAHFQVWGQEPPPEVRLIFPPEPKHNHASCVIETAEGDLVVAWYSGSGERRADDVVIQGASLARGSTEWGPRFVLADTPGYPDCNPVLFAAPDGAIWLFWPTILDHRWEGALLKYAVTEPIANVTLRPWSWKTQGVFHITPQSEGFTAAIRQSLDLLSSEDKRRYEKELAPFEERSRDLLYQRLGWMPRVHVTVLPSGRWILPLYTDTFSVSLMAISDDQGKTWTASRPIAGFGNIQPSVVRRNDGTLVALMRDNGPHRRILVSQSSDEGLNWSPASPTPLPNPGAGIEVIRLASGSWALVYNDTTQGRHSLAVSLSEDEGETWKWTRHLEHREPAQGSFHYPSMIESRDGTIHVTYTRSLPGKGSSIAHARIDENWIRQGDPPR
jgi:predicted neuraminidase